MIPSKPWIVTTPDKVKPSATVVPFCPIPSVTDEKLLKLAEPTIAVWVSMHAWKDKFAENERSEWFVREKRRNVVVCAVADLLAPAYVRDASRFPGTCTKCGRGTYASAFFVEHDGPCGGAP